MALSDASAPLLDPPCYCAAATSTIGTSQPNVLLLFLSDGAPRSWAADPEGFERLLKEKNARKLPNPAIELPEWLEDTRST